jgi:hypothetical protein
LFQGVIDHVNSASDWLNSDQGTDLSIQTMGASFAPGSGTATNSSTSQAIVSDFTANDIDASGNSLTVCSIIETKVNPHQRCPLQVAAPQESLRYLADSLGFSESEMSERIEAGMPFGRLEDAKMWLQLNHKDKNKPWFGSNYVGDRNYLNQPNGWGR